MVFGVTIASGGTSGPRGPGWQSGAGAPVANQAGTIDGDLYLDTTNVGFYYGPRSAGLWGTPHPFGNSLNGVPLVNVTATTNPGATNDNTQGYSRGSLWVNTLTNFTYVATQVTTNAAIWVQTQPTGWMFNVAAYGAVGDGQFVTDGAMTTVSPTVLTSASGKFKSTDVGKLVMVKGAAAAGVTTLVTTIASYQSATQVTLTAGNSSGSNQSGMLVMWATDDTAHIQLAINAAIAYATAFGTAKVFIPTGLGLFYGIGGTLVTGGTTKGNAQLTLGAPVVTTANKVILIFEGVGDGSGLQHWQQLNPQLNGSTLVSFGVFASAGAQASNIAASGNPSVIGGPTQPSGYGIAPGIFSNMYVTVRNMSILTTHSSFGLTYSAVDFSGLAEGGLSNFAWGTTGSVAANDYVSFAGFANGASVGVLMPANGNNDNCRCSNLSCHGGYTWGILATEHFVCDRLTLLYCWSALAISGTYLSSVGATHAVNIAQCSIEACTNLIYVFGIGSNGVGPWVYTTIDTETGAPAFTDNTSGNGLNALLGEVKMTGLFNVSNISVAHPTGLKIINAQNAAQTTSVSANYALTVFDSTILVNANSAPVTVTLISAKWTPNIITVKKTDTSANPVTVATQAGETIDGASTFVINTPHAAATFVPTGGNSGAWNVV